MFLGEKEERVCVYERKNDRMRECLCVFVYVLMCVFIKTMIRAEAAVCDASRCAIVVCGAGEAGKQWLGTSLANTGEREGLDGSVDSGVGSTLLAQQRCIVCVGFCMINKS